MIILVRGGSCPTPTGPLTPTLLLKDSCPADLSIVEKKLLGEPLSPGQHCQEEHEFPDFFEEVQSLDPHVAGYLFHDCCPLRS